MEEIISYLNSVRRDYAGEILDENSVDENPFAQLSKWMEEAINAQILDPAAMILSTVDNENRPSARTVLMRGTTSRGIVFYTNYNSKKSIDLAVNPFVAATFLWEELDRQIRITGRAEKVASEISDRYFAERPRESQLGAIASPQSQKLRNREELLELFEQVKVTFNEKEVKRPDNWGGYEIIIDAIEFWQGRPSRLHDRILYSKQSENDWKIERLAP